jgi:DNA-binding MarR family transcriptional regulator/predicted nucleotidyltransferase
MNYLAFEILELLIKYEGLAPKDISDLLGVSYAATHPALKGLQEKGFVRYEVPATARRTLNKVHPFVSKFREFLAIDSEYKKKLSILSRKSSTSIVHCFSHNQILTRPDLAKKTGFSLKTIKKNLDELLDADIVQIIEARPVRYRFIQNTKNRLFLELNGLLIGERKKESESRMNYHELIELLVANEEVYVLVHYGSTQFGLNDQKSDIDLFLVVSDRETLYRIKSLRFDTRIELNPLLIDKLRSFARKEPEFIKQLASARVLKGRDVLEALCEK